MAMFLVIFLGWSSSGLNAQLSGSYTIDNTKSTSGSNFQSWSSFVSSLTGSGVGGAVSVKVMNNETLTSSLTLSAISGASSTNTITIDGNGNTLSASIGYEVLLFNGADYVTLENLTVENTSTNSYAMLIRFTNGSDYNTINKCTLQYSNRTTGTTSGGGYVWFSSSYTSPSSGTSWNGQNNTISNNLMRTLNSNSPGPSHAIADRGSSSYYSYQGSNNSFKGNTIENFYYYGIYMYNTNGDQADGNDISRKNAGTNRGYTSYLYGVYNYYSYSTDRSNIISNNNIHDLPYENASTSSGTSYLYGVYCYYNYGAGARPNKVENNTVNKCISSTYFYGIYAFRGNDFKIDGNTVSKNYNDGYYFYSIYPYYVSSLTVDANSVVDNENKGYYFYGIYPYYCTGSNNSASDNVVSRNNNSGSSGYTMYLLYLYNGSGTSNWMVERNKLTDNKAYGYTYSSIYAMYVYYYIKATVASNLIANNQCNSTNMCIYFYSPSSAYGKDIIQNTLYVDNANAQYTYNYAYGIYGGAYGDTRIYGNIVNFKNGYYTYPVYCYGSSANVKGIDYNSYYVNNFSGQYWYNPNGSGSDFNGWMNTGLPGSAEKYHDPKFNDIAKGDYKSNAFAAQNNVPASVAVADDLAMVARNATASDRGALESVLDIEGLSSSINLPDSVCSGYTFSADIKIKNNFVDTVKGFNVSFSVNNGAPVNEFVNASIATGDSATITFGKDVLLNDPGLTTVKVFVNVPDDKTSNDTFTFTTIVKPAPGGGVYTPSSSPTATIYQKGRPFDVTVINQPVIYDVNAPRIYSNSTYGNEWTASAYAEKADGSSVSGASVVAPNGSADLEVTFVTSDASLEDETITVVTKITDLTNGCDTLIKRNVLIYPSIDADFKYPAKICDGDAVLFENKSNVKSGGMEFFWNFGTGNAADTSNAPEPVFQFAGAGTYNVVLTAKTLPYGFVFYDTQSVVVNAIPTVAFEKKNACEGENLTFTNKTTPATASSKWDFGDGGTSTSANPTHKYAKAGTYSVTLNANLNGCVASLTQRVYQFDKPTAKWNLVSGTCDNENFVFENNSSISSGLAGSYWDFDDNGAVSTDLDAEHQFSTAGKKKVKLVMTSEFGCKDSLIKQIDVRESPKASFVSTAACSLTPTSFTNTTPDVAGTVANYAWNFGDGTTSSAKSPSKNWTALGPKTVILTVTLDNGCSQTISKDMNVLTQPKASFDAGDVCAGDPVIFVNNTTWPQGEISYNWDFGDNTSSTNSDPSKSYNVIQTTSYNVTLYAYIKGGCADSITQRVTVNEAPRTCDFTVTPDYSYAFFGIKAEPVDGSGVSGGQDNVDYTWIFEGGGSKQTKDKNAAINHEFQNDGTFKVTMRAKVRQTGCECTQTKTIVMNRAAAEGLAKSGVGVYPNPSEGMFNVAMTETIGSQVNLVVTTMSGQVVYSATEANNGLTSVNISDLASGVYMLTVTSENARVTQKITKQ